MSTEELAARSRIQADERARRLRRAREYVLMKKKDSLNAQLGGRQQLEDREKL
eukprot:CAMPEP_0175985920 /NCGR_PEP_ID=MMETSP0108-20121206/49854_1 /TAXON_ID=195067 ORGANISM="Goniomonas pacifica, Strain CCMP1869" /NCGR_SAMPLE_ID=MMETSP0108 /ASSEMBLY_ACC=CAM_ASM_000204 /LENGTH=52 /DNA_ID=CAMNT_0017317005 /DNA_START=6 /DNA_END=160 /DNA_ORIENTATION=-